MGLSHDLIVRAFLHERRLHPFLLLHPSLVPVFSGELLFLPGHSGVLLRQVRKVVHLVLDCGLHLGFFGGPVTVVVGVLRLVSCVRILLEEAVGIGTVAVVLLYPRFVIFFPDFLLIFGKP